MDIILFLLLGIGVGTFGTLVGIGGGLICVPIFILFLSDGGVYPYFHTAAQIAGTSLVVVMANAMSGTMRQLVNNMVVGVSKGFEKKLNLVGVGFRAQASGNKLNLQIGYSHPVNFEMPEGVTVTTPTPTEIIVKGANRQVIGQLAAEIRDARPPEPYKGKGIRYADERVVIKETKKK